MKPGRIPLRSFFRDPPTRLYLLSPNGKMISFLKPWHGWLNIFVRVGARGRLRRITSEKERDVTNYFWKTNDYLIYQQDAGGQLGTHLYCVNLMSGKVSDLTPFKNVRVALVDDLEGISGNEIVIQLMKGKRRIFDAYRLNIRGKGSKMVAQNPGTVWRWITDNAGLVRAAVSIQGTNDCLLTRCNEQSQFRLARTMDFRRSINRLSSIFYTRSNKGIVAISSMRRNRDKAAVAIISTRTGREIRCIYKNQRVDVESFAFSRRRKVITYATFRTSKLEQKIFDRQTAGIFKTLRKRLRGYVIEIVACDQAEKKFIVLARNDRQPGKRYLFDAPNERLTLLANVAPWLNEKKLAPVSPIRFHARDGLTIHGYLTVPVGRTPKKLPLIINVHGGPENRDYWEYAPRESAEAQFLANRGYAVLQLNFRGSVGYGRSFWQKGFGERGRKMQNDVTDGVHWLIERGIADSKRIAIYGKSYGGYAALVGVTFAPDLYQAAIDYAGISNSVTWLNKFSPYNQPLLPQFYVKVGHPEKDRKRLEAVAPALHADQIKKPLLIAHGSKDPTVPKSESDQMVAALIAARPEGDLHVEYMVKADEFHTFQREENKTAFYEAMEAFLAKHLR